MPGKGKNRKKPCDEKGGSRSRRKQEVSTLVCEGETNAGGGKVPRRRRQSTGTLRVNLFRMVR